MMLRCPAAGGREEHVEDEENVEARDCLHLRLDPVPLQLRTMFAALLWAGVCKLATLAFGFIGRFVQWLVDRCRAVRHARTVEHVHHYLVSLEEQWYAISISISIASSFSFFLSSTPRLGSVRRPLPQLLLAAQR